MIVDTSALLAFFDSSEPAHDVVAKAIESTNEPLVVSPFVVAELDYIVLTRHGSRAEALVLDELSSGSWELATFDIARFTTASSIVKQYADIPIGITDASNIVLADAYQTRTIATLDRKHFSILRLPDGTAPALVP